MKPLISIITSTLNAGATFVQTADSIRAQTRRDAVEWLIADGVSRDNTLELIKRNEDIVSYWHSQKDSGIYQAWNTLLPHVSGEWVWAVGADDQLLESQTVERLMAALGQMPDTVGWVYGQVRIFGEGYALISGEAWEVAQKKMFGYMSVPHQGVLVRASVLRAIGGFAEEFKIAGDYECLIKLLVRGYQPQFIEQVLINMKAEGVSARPENGVRSMREVLQVRRKHQIQPLYPWPWCWQYVKALVLKLIVNVLGKAMTAKIFATFQIIFDRRAKSVAVNH